MNYSKQHYIRMISQASNRYGDKLLQLMDRYNKHCLSDITLSESVQFCRDNNLITKWRYNMIYLVGEEICDEPLVTVSEVTDIIPTKWDSIQECYIACNPMDAHAFMIKTQDGELIAITSDCKNKDTLIDIL